MLGHLCIVAVASSAYKSILRSENVAESCNNEGTGMKHDNRGPDFPPTFWELVERAATDRPHQVLLADDHGRSLTSAQFRDVSSAVAAGLFANGIGSATVVSWQLPTMIESLILLAALARLDAVQNPIIPMLREREVRFITQEVGTEVFIVADSWRGFDHAALAFQLADERPMKVIVVDVNGALGPDTILLPVGDPAMLPTRPGADSTSDGATTDRPVRWIYHTSGTTADPKGARHTDWSVMHGAWTLIERMEFDHDDVYPVAFPMTHIGGAVILATFLVTGARLVLFDTFDPQTTPERMAAHGPTLLGTAVPFYNAYLAAQQRHGDTPLFPRLRACMGGGAPVPSELHRALGAAFGVVGVIGSYGLTEFPNVTSCCASDPPEVLARSVGKPGTGIEIRAVDGDGNDVGIDCEGELVMRGPQRLVGYMNPSLNESAFFTGGWFRSGDLGRIDANGDVWITGRLKEIVIRNAENISVLEIEDVLARHPSVLEAAVIGLADARTGERVCAVVVTSDSSVLTLDALRTFCAGLGLARHKCPEQIEHVDVLPRNAMGKVKKQELIVAFS